MQAISETTPISKPMLWTGIILSVLPGLFLLVDAVMKLVKPPVVVDATVKLGYAESIIVPLGIILLISTILYFIPRTSVLGAILLVGYLGGAVNTHVRMNEGLFPILFPVFFGVLLWGGLYLREHRLTELLPLTTTQTPANKKIRWGGIVLSILPSLLLLFSAAAKLSGAPQVQEGFAKFGYQPSAILAIGIVELGCTILYLIPKTSVLGAILLTGYMGGALVTHMRVGEPFIAQILFGVVLWVGLYLRNEKLRTLIPLKK